MKSLLVILTVAFLALSTAAFGTQIGDDGLHKQPWFSTTFRDIAEDIETSEADGKRLMMIFEQRGCIYCQRLHETVFSDPEVAAYIQEHFMVVQYNMFGDEEVIDLDGRELTEKTAVRAWNIVFTPTIMFLPESVPDDVTAAQAAVATMPGAFGRWTSLHMFQWVVEKGYETEEHFQKYHARKLDEARASGALVE